MKYLYLSLLVAVVACSRPAPTPAPPAPSASSDPQPTPQANQDLPISHKPRPASFVPASPDTRSQKEIDIAACTGTPDAAHPDGWRCAGKKPISFKAAATSPIIPGSWTVPNWFVNKTTGNDSNACTSSGAACATKQEIVVHRLGCGQGSNNCPRFQQTTTLEQDTSDTDNTDPFYLHPALEKGASFVLQGGTPASTAAVFTLNTAKNRGVGTNALLSGSFSAGAPAKGLMVQNTTALKSSRAWIYKTAGGANWNLTQPATPQTVPGVSFYVPSEVDTWASTDTVNVLTPVAINVVDVGTTLADNSASFNNAFILYQMTIFSPLGAGNDNVHLGNQVLLVESASQRTVDWLFANEPFGLNGESNSYLLGSIASSPTANTTTVANLNFLAGGVDASLAHAFLSGANVDVDAILGQGSIVLGGISTFGTWAIDGAFTVDYGLVSTVGATPVWYGTGANTINVSGSAHLANVSGATFANVFTAPGLVTGIQLNAKTAVVCNSGADPGVLHNATTTPAHLDAACGAGSGLGGAAFVPAGASVATF